MPKKENNKKQFLEDKSKILELATSIADNIKAKQQGKLQESVFRVLILSDIM
jgi:hypothetical protein